MKRAVIFDLDGLLIDSEVVSHQLMDELLRQYGYSLTKAEYARIYSGKTGIGNMTHMIETYHLPLTVAEGMAWEAKREAELLPFIARGRSARVIADALFVSENTIRTHTRRILEKTDLHSKQQVIDLIEKYR